MHQSRLPIHIEFAFDRNPKYETLEIDSYYTGPLGLNQLMVIDTLTVYYEDKQVTNVLTNPV